MRRLMAISALLTLGACGGGHDGAHRLQAPGDGPDEFAGMPLRPLEIPPTNALPTPTPGGANRADPNPLGDAVAALGGDPRALLPGGVPARDGALVAAASRNGVTADIRALVAQEDAAYRARAGRFSTGGLLGGNDPYWRTYARQALDAGAEIARFREAGIAVPSAPPEALAE